MSEEKLKPCLRCGRMPHIRYRMPCAQVVCKCGAHTAVICDSYEQGDSKQVAAARWNARQCDRPRERGEG